jgi:hypothetical protein
MKDIGSLLLPSTAGIIRGGAKFRRQCQHEFSAQRRLQNRQDAKDAKRGEEEKKTFFSVFLGVLGVLAVHSCRDI